MAGRTSSICGRIALVDFVSFHRGNGKFFTASITLAGCSCSTINRIPTTYLWLARNEGIHPFNSRAHITCNKNVFSMFYLPSLLTRGKRIPVARPWMMVWSATTSTATGLLLRNLKLSYCKQETPIFAIYTHIMVP